MPQTVFLALVLINIWTVFRFWQDKSRAIAGLRRIPEADLLGLALIGGTPGAFLARHLFRHKTRKQPFSSCLITIAVAQIGAVVGTMMFLKAGSPGFAELTGYVLEHVISETAAR